MAKAAKSKNNGTGTKKSSVKKTAPKKTSRTKVPKQPIVGHDGTAAG